MLLYDPILKPRGDTIANKMKAPVQGLPFALRTATVHHSIENLSGLANRLPHTFLSSDKLFDVYWIFGAAHPVNVGCLKDFSTRLLQ